MPSCRTRWLCRSQRKQGEGSSLHVRSESGGAWLGSFGKQFDHSRILSVFAHYPSISLSKSNAARQNRHRWSKISEDIRLRINFAYSAVKKAAISIRPTLRVQFFRQWSF